MSNLKRAADGAQEGGSDAKIPRLSGDKRALSEIDQHVSRRSLAHRHSRLFGQRSQSQGRRPRCGRSGELAGNNVIADGHQSHVTDRRRRLGRKGTDGPLGVQQQGRARGPEAV